MNYPLQSLAIIAPIVFILLMIIVPVIGVFAGWKRAAYWGGGTFFFFLLGMIIWKAAGVSISAGLVPLVNGFLSGIGATATPQLVASLTAPLFFILVMAIAYLILVINYYAWFKRVSKIKQDIALKKQMKAAKKAGKAIPKVKGSGWTTMQFTSAGKAINMACGGAGLALLLAPSTVTFTQAIMYTTTSVTTRANNSLCAGLYASLESTASAFSWMSYYGDCETGKDYNSLFSTIEMMNTDISYEYYDEVAGTTKTVSGKVGDVLVNVIETGYGNLLAKTTNPDMTKTDIENTVKTIAHAWNGLVENNLANVASFFQSANITQVFESMIGQEISKKDLSDDDITNYFGEGTIFEAVVNDYINDPTWPEESKITQIPISPESIENIVQSVNNFVITDNLSDTNKQIFNEKLHTLVNLIFVAA